MTMMRLAPVAHMTTVWALLAAVQKWSISQLDVKNALLNGKLLEVVYMQKPPRYIVSLMALSASAHDPAPHAWFESFSSVITGSGSCSVNSHFSSWCTLLLLYFDDRRFYNLPPISWDLGPL